MNYESPINIISQQMKIQMEGEIMKAVQRVGIDVDKDELIRALQYDRGQYQKGYMDGFRDALDGKGQAEEGGESECF